MNTIFTQLQIFDGGFFLFLGVGTIALVLFRRACQISLECPKDTKIADYWGRYAQEDCTQCRDIRVITQRMKSSPPQEAELDVPRVYTAAH